MNELFGINSKGVRVFIIVYVVLAIAVLVMIWWPKGGTKTADFAYYQEYTQKQVAEKMAEYYTDNIYNKIILGDSTEIINRVSEDYLQYNGFKKEDVLQHLNENNVFDINTTIGQVTVNTDVDNYIYSFDLINGSNRVRMNLIETYPYDYYITFDNHVSYYEFNIEKQFDKMTIKIENVYSSIDYIEYTLEITNNEYDSLEFNLATVTDAYITYSDGSRLALANPIKYDDEQLNKGASIRKKIKFELPINVQANIEQITFTNVIIEGEKEIITIDI